MKKTIFLFLLTSLLAACKQDNPASQPAATQQPTTPPPAQPAATLPSVPLELLEKIYQEGTQVDYIFYNDPFTMSLTDKPSIQYAMRLIAEQPAPLKPGCKAKGRVTYQIKGEIVLEGDFYFSTGCTYFVFEKDRVKTYANYMTDDGIKYFNEQIQQAMKMQQGLQQQATPGQ